jgi:hypothetical protein
MSASSDSSARAARRLFVRPRLRSSKRSRCRGARSGTRGTRASARGSIPRPSCRGSARGTVCRGAARARRRRARARRRRRGPRGAARVTFGGRGSRRRAQAIYRPPGRTCEQVKSRCQRRKAGTAKGAHRYRRTASLAHAKKSGETSMSSSRMMP